MRISYGMVLVCEDKIWAFSAGQSMVAVSLIEVCVWVVSIIVIFIQILPKMGQGVLLINTYPVFDSDRTNPSA